jgi:hypothetical protein
MEKDSSIFVGRIWRPVAMLVLLVLSAGAGSAGDCTSARSSVDLITLDPSESPPGYQSADDQCFAGLLRGPLKGTMILCISGNETVTDDNLCSCDSGGPLWEREGEGGVTVYRSKSWFTTRAGDFEAVERGVQLDNTGYPQFSYPGPRQYWTGVTQILPDSGTGDYQDLVYGTIIIHNEWNDPSKAELFGEICSP